MDTEEWIRKGIFSFIIGFIITIVLGVIMAFIFAQTGFQSFILTGGLPLTWLYLPKYSFGFNLAVYDYFAFVLDLMFWAFIVFLIVTKKKKIKDKKQIGIGSYFDVKPDKKEIKLIGIISLSIAITLIAITVIVSSITVGAADKTQSFDIEVGFPLYFILVSSAGFEISNWFNLFFDFIFYISVVFGISYFIETILKNKKQIKKI